MRFVQHHITTTNFYSAGRIGEFAKSDGRDEVEVDAGYDAERDLRGLHFQVTDPHSVVGYGLTRQFRMYACLQCSTRIRGRRSSAFDLRRMRRVRVTIHKTGNSTIRRLMLSYLQLAQRSLHVLRRSQRSSLPKQFPLLLKHVAC